jgi:hypothetical protein
VNAPALARAGYLGWRVAREHRRRVASYHVQSWDEILLQYPLPWELDEMSVLDVPAASPLADIDSDDR